MAGIIVDISARTKAFTKGMTRLRKTVMSMAMWLPKQFAKMGMRAARALTGGIIRNTRRAAMGVGAALVAGIGKSIAVSAEFERSEIQLEALIGTAEEARQRMKALEDVALDVTFDLTSLVKANRHLTVFTGNAMAGKDAMMMIADAASVTPNEIEDVAFWFGRAYAMIDSGRPMGEAVMRLTEMGLMSREAASQLKKLERSFSPQAQAKKMDVLVGSLMRFEGANEKLLGTLSGQFSLFRDATTLAFKDIGDAIAPLTKVWLEELISKIRKFRKDGTFDRWGKNIANWLDDARRSIEVFIPSAIAKFKKFKASAKEVYESIKGDNWSETIGNGIEMGLDKALSIAVKKIEEYTPAFVKAGTTIGLGIGKGIAKGLSQSKGARVLAALSTWGGSEYMRNVLNEREMGGNAKLNKSVLNSLTEGDMRNLPTGTLQDIRKNMNLDRETRWQAGRILIEEQQLRALTTIASNTTKKEGGM